MCRARFSYVGSEEQDTILPHIPQSLLVFVPCTFDIGVMRHLQHHMALPCSISLYPDFALQIEVLSSTASVYRPPADLPSPTQHAFWNPRAGESR